MTKNLNCPCPFCGCEIITDSKFTICHPIDSCVLSGFSCHATKWNSRHEHPLDKKVEEFRNFIDDMYRQYPNHAIGFRHRFKQIFGDK